MAGLEIVSSKQRQGHLLGLAWRTDGKNIKVLSTWREVPEDQAVRYATGRAGLWSGFLWILLQVSRGLILLIF